MSNPDHASRSHSTDAYRHLFHQVDTALARADLDGHFIDVNPSFAQALQRPAHELIGCHVLDWCEAEHMATHQAQLHAALAGQAQVQLTWANHTAPASNAPLSQWTLHLSLVHDGEGQAIELACTLHPVGEPLPASIGPFTGDLHSPDILRELSQAMRNPLNAILGFAQLLKVDPQHPISAPQTDKITHIEQAGAMLLRLLSDAVDLSRVGTPQSPLHIQPHPTSMVIDAAIKDVMPVCQPKQIQVRAAATDSVMRVWADSLRLRQLLHKLLQQAVQRAAPASIVRISTLRHEQEVAIEIQTAHHAQEFNGTLHKHPFDESDLSAQLCQRLALLMHGRLETSDIGPWGQSVKVWLPWAQTEPSTAAPNWGPTSAFAELDPIASEQPLTVLYAEDNVVNIELVRQVLRMRPQWHLKVAYCGQEAITMALMNPPDLLLLDMHLGDMKGLEVAQVLARHPHTAPVPKVALSADVMPDRIKEALAQGFLDYLTKPLDVSKLMRLLDRMSQHKLSTPQRTAW